MFAAEWKRIATGNGEIDVAHAELTAIAAALDESCQHGDYESVSDDDIKRLFEIATRLFGLEKSAMEEIHYKWIFEHIEDHEILEEMIISARRQISSKLKALIRDAMEPLSFSIIGHIETMDVPLAEAISFKSRKPALNVQCDNIHKNIDFFSNVITSVVNIIGFFKFGFNFESDWMDDEEFQLFTDCFEKDEEYYYDEDAECYCWYDEEYEAWYWLNEETHEWLLVEDDYKEETA